MSQLTMTVVSIKTFSAVSSALGGLATSTNRIASPESKLKFHVEKAFHVANFSHAADDKDSGNSDNQCYSCCC